MTTIRDSFRSLRLLPANFDHWTRSSRRFAASASTWNGWHGLWAPFYLVCLPALRRGAWANTSTLNGGKSGTSLDSHSSGANQFLRRTVNAQTNPWQEFYIHRVRYPTAACVHISSNVGSSTGAHDRAPVVEDPARLAGLPYWLAE